MDRFTCNLKNKKALVVILASFPGRKTLTDDVYGENMLEFFTIRILFVVIGRKK